MQLVMIDKAIIIDLKDKEYNSKNPKMFPKSRLNILSPLAKLSRAKKNCWIMPFKNKKYQDLRLQLLLNKPKLDRNLDLLLESHLNRTRIHNKCSMSMKATLKIRCLHNINKTTAMSSEIKEPNLNSIGKIHSLFYKTRTIFSLSSYP